MDGNAYEIQKKHKTTLLFRNYRDNFLLHFWCPNLKSEQKGVLWESEVSA